MVGSSLLAILDNYAFNYIIEEEQFFLGSIGMYKAISRNIADIAILHNMAS